MIADSPTIRALQGEVGASSPLLMGIVNVTPDSFSDGDLFLDSDRAIKHAQTLQQNGADILDVGGEATGPGTTAITADEELARILTVVAALAEKHFISVDTYKAETAARVLEHGARMINDVSALRADSGLSNVVAEHNAYIVLMHSKESDQTPHASESIRDYQDIIREISDFLHARVDFALAHGIAEDRIILDPGLGRFLSHDARYSWELLERLDELCSKLPFPFLIGTSRKSFLGGEISDRDPLSQLTALSAALHGARIIRTHNTKMARMFFDTWQQLQPHVDVRNSNSSTDKSSTG